MAGLKTELKGTTLLESVIAMSLITIVFVVGIKVFDYAIKADSFALKQRAASVCDSLVNQVKNERFFVDENVFVEGLTYQITFEEYAGFKNTLEIGVLGIGSNGERLYELKELIHAR